ncbi:MAG: hypothetical protein ACP5OA_01790 [Candidatus Woesearchaeota archaeon]
MDFEQYLEKDILKFLDSKIEKKDRENVNREEEYGLYLTKDYLKELTYVLDNDELTKAKKLFDELKVTYTKLPKSSFERKKVYTILEKMYGKIQNYVEIKEGKVEIIKEGQSEIHKDKIQDFAKYIKKLPEMPKLDVTEEWDISSLKSTALPIHLNVEENIYEKKEPESSIMARSVESNILGQTLKDDVSKPQSLDENNKSAKADTYIEVPIMKKAPTYESKSADEQKYIPLREKVIEKKISPEKVYTATDNPIINLRLKIERDAETQKDRINKSRDEKLQQLNAEREKESTDKEHEIKAGNDHISKEVLEKVYTRVGEITSSKDVTKNFMRDEQIEEPEENNVIDNLDEWKTPENENLINSEFKDKGTNKKNFSNEELKTVYEQAIYYMFNEKYDEAAKIFKKILDAQPTNKAAHIRLQECMEKNPELVDKYSNLKESLPYVSDTHSQNNISRNRKIIFSEENIENANYERDPYKRIKREQITQKNSDEEVKKMHSQAVHLMFLDNYAEAANIFRQILQMKPSDRVAKIRLEECIGEINNA